MTNKPIVTAIQSNLSTNDINRLKSFYRELFGAEEHMRVPAKGKQFYVVLRVGAADLGIVKGKSGSDASPGRVILDIFIESVDDLLPRVEPAGGTVLGAANDMPWGHRVAHITDPDGNPINLTQAL